MVKITSIEIALKLFEKAAIKHAEATDHGNYKMANKNYGIIMKCVKFLKDEGEMQLLSVFLDNFSVGVQVWAASFLLSINEAEAIKSLEKNALCEGIQSLNAEMILQEWKKGALEFPDLED